MILRADQVGGVAVAMSSENVTEISTPPGAKAVDVKLDQLIITRPVSGSTSANSLSAASRAFAADPVSKPCGLVAVGISNGPDQVWPLSVDRCTHIVWAVPVAFSFLTMIEK